MKKEELKQSPVVFTEDPHAYHLDGRELGGVTRIVSWLFPETYQGVSEELMNRAAERGTLVHAKCEMADNTGIVDGDEAQAYVDMMQGEKLTTIANEYTVSDEQNIASNIDIVCEDLSLGDIKTSSAIHTPNVTVQLSIYAYLFELQNAGEKVNKLFVVWLPKPQYGKPCIKYLQRIPTDDVKYIIDEYLAGSDNTAARERYDALNIPTDEEMPTAIKDTYEEMIAIRRQMDALKTREDELKLMWLTVMQEAGKKKAENAFMTVIRKESSIRASIDSKRLKNDYPDIYAKCIKESKVSESLTIKIL